MNRYIFKRSLLSLATFALLCSGCQDVEETETGGGNDSTTQEVVQELTPEEEQLAVEAAINQKSEDAQQQAMFIAEEPLSTKPTAIQDEQNITPTQLSKERIALDEKYNQKLIECYTLADPQCDNIIDEMTEATIELTIQEQEIAMQKELPITQEQLQPSTMPTQQTEGVNDAY